jgi:cysteinyl-tRNA synthetase
MSKSKNNFYSMKDIVEKGFSPLDLRYLYLEAHYRFPQNFTWEALEGARSARKNLVEQMSMFLTLNDGKKPEDVSKNEYREKFATFLADDLNIPGALSVVWEVVKSPELSVGTKVALLAVFDMVLGLKLSEAPTLRSTFSSEEIEEILKIVNDRESAKKEKNWARADELRNRLTEKKVRVVDTKEGVVIVPA